MDYISTRDARRQRHTFSDILLGGLAADGGLYLPAEYPQLNDSDLTRLRTILNEEGYAALAGEVLTLFIDDADIPADDVRRLAANAYHTPTFSDEAIVPVAHLDNNLYLGRLSMGPTAAFKDMAMQLLGELFEYELDRRGETLNILGATSGDTGSAAEYAMRGRHGITVFMLTPRGRMTPFQQAQMFGLLDDNVFNIALDGVFDDCQDVVKAVAQDAEFKRRWRIGAVNSINWARLLAQVVYYISCWIRITNSNDEKVSFSVPTGNFGDICAGHIARQMGLPIDKLIVATNENSVLEEFFRTGRYQVDREALQTSSPSMDISKASNFERFVFDLLDRDASRIAELFGEQVPAGGFDLHEDPAFPQIAATFGFYAGTSTHADRLTTIADLHRRLDVLVDPHTADGIHVAKTVAQAQHITTPIVCLETALPVKFADTIAEAIGEAPAPTGRFAGIMDADRKVVDLPNDAAVVKAFIAEQLAARVDA
ncbi:threonine synthase [Corynebacterium choanae]|uniref:Threonine synthase n=1 Tax=Corynebacterium choanae TaxID=1862358 RepID=A0A3G6JAF0_9CORY|nr:threonine synthase [Corynebacterium choanae]AZA13450.1 Threonine synthase [Corynebacterium choanae]